MEIYYVDNPQKYEGQDSQSIISQIKPIDSLVISASRYRYQVVCLYLYTKFGVMDAKVDIAPLISAQNVLDKKACVCLNNFARDIYGKENVKPVAVPPKTLYPIYIGMDLSQAKLTRYNAVISVGTTKLKLTVDVKDMPISNPEFTALGRLNWLNSDYLSNTGIAKGFEPIAYDGNTLKLTGKEIRFASSGLISDVVSHYTKSCRIDDKFATSLFFRPMEFEVVGQKLKYGKPNIINNETFAIVTSDGKNDNIKYNSFAKIHYEGKIEYSLSITALKGIIIPDVNLNLYFASYKYDMGFGLPGGEFRPTTFKFDVDKNQNSIYVGDVNCGAVVEYKANDSGVAFVDSKYAYKKISLPKDSFDNYGEGVINLYEAENSGCVLTSSTGRIILAEGETMTFNFDIKLTPFRPINMRRKVAIRPYQPKVQTNGIIADATKRVRNYLDLNWGSDYYPYANNIIYSEKVLKKLALESHNNDIGVLVDYTPSVVSATASDTKALLNLGDDVLFRYFGNKLIGRPAGYCGQINKKQKPDTLYATVPGGRMENYFVEGVKYLIDDIGVDGISLVEGGLRRNTAERVRKLLDNKNGFPGIMQLTLYDKNYADCGYACDILNQADVLSFVDKLKLTKSIECTDKNRILTETSGLLFGTTAEAPEGTNPILAYLYGMGMKYTTSDKIKENDKKNYSLQNIIDVYGIGEADFYGYWDDTNPITSDKPNVCISSYIAGKTLIAFVYNFSDCKEEFEIGINPKKGYTTKGKKYIFPEIDGIQRKKKNYDFNSSLKLPKHSGMVIIIK